MLALMGIVFLHFQKVFVSGHIQVLLHQRKGIEKDIGVLGKRHARNIKHPVIFNLNSCVHVILVEFICRSFRGVQIDSILQTKDAREFNHGLAFVVQDEEISFRPE